MAALQIALAAQAQIRIGVPASSSGPIAQAGIPQRNTVALLPKEVAGQKIDYFSLDDASDPTASAAAVKKLINEDKALRATAVNRLGAELMGISPTRAGRMSFALAAFIGALSAS